jgi:hypothetical protein
MMGKKAPVSLDQIDLFALAAQCLKRNHSLHDAIDEMMNLAKRDPDILAGIIREYFLLVARMSNEKRAPVHIGALAEAEPEAKYEPSEPLFRPVLSPSPVDLRAARQAQQKIAENVLDVLRIDRRPIGDWTLGECRTASVGKLREAYILKNIGQRYVNVDPHKRVRDVLKDEDLQEIIEESGRAVDAAYKR